MKAIYLAALCIATSTSLAVSAPLTSGSLEVDTSLVLPVGEETLTLEEQNTIDKKKRTGGYKTSPTLDASIDKNTIFPGESVELQWSSRFTLRGVMLLPENVRLERKGVLTLSPNETTTYTLVAENKYGSTEKTVTVTVLSDAAAPSKPTLDMLLSSGSMVEINWSASSDDHTTQDNIIYNVYYSDSGPKTSSDELTLIDSVIGSTNLTFSSAQPNSLYHIYLTAEDKAGNVSSLSEAKFVKTGEVEVVLRDDRPMTILDDIGAEYVVQSSTEILITQINADQHLSIGDLIFIDSETHYLSGEIQDITTSPEGIRVIIRAINPLDLIQEGDININVSPADNESSAVTETAPATMSLSSFLGSNITFDDEVALGPLTVGLSVNVTPTYNYTLQMRDYNTDIDLLELNVHADWTAEATSTLRAAAEYSGTREFSIDALNARRVIRVRLGRRLPLRFVLETEVNGSISLTSDGEAELSGTMNAVGIIDETVVYENDAWIYNSQSNIASMAFAPQLNVAATAQSTLVLIPKISLTAMGIFRSSSTVKGTIDAQMGAEPVPQLDTVTDVYPERVLQLSNLDINANTRCTNSTSLVLPLGLGERSLNEENGCTHDYPLFSLPAIDMTAEPIDQCTSYNVFADDTDGVNNPLNIASSQWIRRVGEAATEVGPTGVSQWEYTGSEDGHIIFSAFGVLGEPARRFFAQDINSNSNLEYAITVFQDEGIYVTGTTPEEACLNLEAQPGFVDDDWDFMGVVSNQCYFAESGISDPDLDVYVPINTYSTCS